MFCFTSGERKIWSNFKMSQNIMTTYVVGKIHLTNSKSLLMHDLKLLVFKTLKHDFDVFFEVDSSETNCSLKFEGCSCRRRTMQKEKKVKLTSKDLSYDAITQKSGLLSSLGLRN